MKILMVNKYLYPKGGAETYAFELADYLTSQGHEVAFFGMEDARNSKGNSLGLGVGTMEFREFSLKQITYPFRIIYSIEARKKIGKVLKAFKPDYVHLNNINFHLTPSILYEIKQQKIPMIQTIHDFQIVCPNHMMYREHDLTICEACKGRRYGQCIRYKCIHNSRIKSILGAFEGWLYYQKKTYDLIDAFIAPSQFLADKIVDFGEDPKKIHTIHNFIANSDQRNAFIKKDYFLYFGRLSIQKGIRTLMNVIRNLPEVNFVIAGGGELEPEVAAAKLPNLAFVGFQKNESLKQYIGQARASILPSEWYENCPMAVLESLALGTPVIGSEIGGIPELVDHGIDGLLFQPGKEKSLETAILAIAKNHQMAADMSERALQKVETFSIEQYEKKMMEIVKPICGINSL